MIKKTRHPYGHKKLLVYQKAGELQKHTTRLTSHFSRSKPFADLADQMNRSARSTKQNVVEGWKRNSTNEYYQFLGFSIASNAELEEDCNDIISNVHPALLRIKGVTGGEEISIDEAEELRFYPLDIHLPPIVQLKLRAKELNFLIDRLQKSLLKKMEDEGTLSTADRRAMRRSQKQKAEKWYKNMLKERGLVRLENGRVVSKKEWDKRAKGEKWVKRDEGG